MTSDHVVLLAQIKEGAIKSCDECALHIAEDELRKPASDITEVEIRAVNGSRYDSSKLDRLPEIGQVYRVSGRLVTPYYCFIGADGAFRKASEERFKALNESPPLSYYNKADLFRDNGCLDYSAAEFVLGLNGQGYCDVSETRFTAPDVSKLRAPMPLSRSSTPNHTRPGVREAIGRGEPAFPKHGRAW